MCVREVSFQERYFLCAAPVHTESKGLNLRAALKTEAKVTGGNSKDFLKPAVLSLSPCLSHPGDCKHWLPATTSHSTKLLCAFSIYIYAFFMEAEAKARYCCEHRERVSVLCKGRHPVLLECESTQIRLFSGASHVTELSLSWSDFLKSKECVECCHLIRTQKSSFICHLSECEACRSCEK